MAESKQREAWNHTAPLLSMVANVFGSGKAKPSDFHPYFERDEKKEKSELPNPIGIEVLRVLL
jgi:hypothetical protein